MLIFGIIFFTIIAWGNGIVGVENNDEYVKTIAKLATEINEKDMLIFNYQREILDLTTRYYNLEEVFNLTKHSLNLANEALDRLDIDIMNDSNDYDYESFNDKGSDKNSYD